MIGKLRDKIRKERRRGKSLRDIPGSLAGSLVKHVAATKRYLFLYRDLSWPLDPLPRRCLKYHSRFADSSDIKKIDYVGAGRKRLFRSYLAEGYRMWCTYEGSTILCVSFVTSTSVYYKTIAGFIEPRKGQLFHIDGIVPPHARGRGIAAVHATSLIENSRERGFRSMCVFVQTNNTPTVRIHARLGFVPQSQVDCPEFLGIKSPRWRETVEERHCRVFHEWRRRRAAQHTGCSVRATNAVTAP